MAQSQTDGASTQPATESAEGTVFDGIGLTDTNTVSVSPENGDSQGPGNFTVGSLNTATDGQEGWRFNFDSQAIAQTVTQTFAVRLKTIPQ
jgi:hypothetical protein